MIEVDTVSIFVSDQDRALDFYLTKLGFEKRMDMPMGPDSRWLTVAPPGSKTAFVLYKPTTDAPGASTYEDAIARIGKMTNVVLNTDDMAKTYSELSGRGVTFNHPPTQEPWGWWAEFQDQDGNIFGVHQA